MSIDRPLVPLSGSVFSDSSDDPTLETNDEMILSTENLTKKFGDLAAVNGVSWSVERGRTKAIIGPNGAGKSTFFNLLSGLLQPTSGRVQFNGIDITNASPHEIAREGLVKTSQITDVFEEATVYENIRIAAQVTETTYDVFSHASGLVNVNETTERILKEINMTHARDEVAENLSYGDQRKVEIGIALATSPSLILFDEPTAGMSPEETEGTINLIEDLKGRTDLSIVITEHNIDLIFEIADQITVFHNGEILENGPPAAIRASDEVKRVYLGE